MHRFLTHSLLLASLLTAGAAPAQESAPAPETPGDFRREIEARGRIRLCIVLDDKSLPADSRERKREKFSAAQDALLAALAGLPPEKYALRYRYRSSPVVVLELKGVEALDAVVRHPGVKRLQPDVVGSGALIQSRKRVRADGALDLGITGSGTVAAILDSGVDTGHPDVQGAVIHQFHFLDGGADVGGGAEDGHTHGSNVTGIAASRGTLAPLGIAPGAQIVAIKVLDDQNLGYLSDWAAGVEYVVDLHELDASKGGIRIDAINMSLATRSLYGGACDDEFLAFSAACERAVEAGIAVFVASGNNGRTTQLAAPGCFSSVFTVGATTDTLPESIASFSNRNALLELVAPGDCITSMGVNGGLSTMQGTSQATPHATAAACLLRQVAPEITPAGILQVLQATGSPISDPATGLTFARVDVLAAVLSLQDGPDCNGNGAPDLRDIYVTHASNDCNENRVPDECDLETGASRDCNWNDIPDECDVAPRLVLGEPVEQETGDYPTDIVAADFDGDGREDLATANAFADTVSIFLSRGAGVLEPAAPITVGDRPGALVAGDINGDGRVDLIAADTGAPTIPGTTLSVLLQGEGGTFAHSPVTAGRGPVALALGDLDADGDLDLAVGHTASRDVHLFANDGLGTFVPLGVLPEGAEVRAVILARLDADQYFDLALITTGTDTISIYRNDGIGGFTPLPPVPTGRTPAALIAFDANGDGSTDLATGNISSNDISILLGDGSGAFVLAASYLVGGEPGSLAAADLEGDGDLDLAVAGRSCRNLSVFENVDGLFSCLESYGAGTGAKTIVAADLDGHGFPALAAASQNSDIITIVANASSPPRAVDGDGDGEIDACGVPRPPFHRGDVDADGDLTISDGITLFNFLFLTGQEPTCAEAADADNSGNLDITDGLKVLNYLFLGGAAPAPPGPPGQECGPDPDAPGSPGDLGCASYRC